MFKTPTEVLERARKRLEDPARWERIHFQVNGRYCLYGSLGYLGCMLLEPSLKSDEIPHVVAAKDLLKRTVQRYTGNNIDTIGGFNGRNSTQHSDILKVLDIAIDEAKQAGT